MKLLLATHNRDKVREIEALLAPVDVDVVDLSAFPGLPPTVEDGDTLEANALKKAREAREATGITALADDTGLEVQALGGRPGVYAARFAGQNATYADNCEKLLRELEGVPAARRDAVFRTVVALALTTRDRDRIATEHDAYIAEGILPGRIALAPRGDSGFGYDPVFVDTGTGKTLAEMKPAEKNRRSHRYRALVEMRELMLRLGLAGEKERS